MGERARSGQTEQPVCSRELPEPEPPATDPLVLRGPCARLPHRLLRGVSPSAARSLWVFGDRPRGRGDPPGMDASRLALASSETIRRARASRDVGGPAGARRPAPQVLPGARPRACEGTAGGCRTRAASRRQGGLPQANSMERVAKAAQRCLRGAARGARIGGPTAPSEVRPAPSAVPSQALRSPR